MKNVKISGKKIMKNVYYNKLDDSQNVFMSKYLSFSSNFHEVSEVDSFISL